MTHNVFVYGTLKRGQCREKCWPVEPVEIVPGWTLGELYDTGPFPAMVHGEDRVLGEVWMYEADQIARVLQVLDEIEVTNQPGCENEYDREVVNVNLRDGRQLSAQTYIYAQRWQLSSFRRVLPKSIEGIGPFAAWP